MDRGLPIVRMVMPPLQAGRERTASRTGLAARPLAPRKLPAVGALVTPERNDEFPVPAPPPEARPEPVVRREGTPQATPPGRATPHDMPPAPPRRPQAVVVPRPALQREGAPSVPGSRTPEVPRAPSSRLAPAAKQMKQPQAAAPVRVTEKVVERRVTREIVRERPMVVRTAPVAKAAPEAPSRPRGGQTDRPFPSVQQAAGPRPAPARSRETKEAHRIPAAPEPAKPRQPEWIAQSSTVRTEAQTSHDKPRPMPVSPPERAAPAATPRPTAAAPRPARANQPRAPRVPPKPTAPAPTAKPPAHHPIRPAPEVPKAPSRVEVEIGKIEITSKPSRPAAKTPPRKPRRPRGHGIDPGLPFPLGRP